ncbi:MAG: sensor histidine kinase [Actinomycetota bacterium]|nr:sensor histidine kinase [Actinomycetota bacterium]
MHTLRELLRRRVDDEDVVAHLELLLTDWQILADLSFADLLLFVPDPPGRGEAAFCCVGQMRPYTAQTMYPEDLVGRVLPAGSRPLVRRAFAEGRVIRDADPDWSSGVPVREEAVPVRFRGDVVAVVTREANVATARSPSQLELTYLQTADELAGMLASGTFPFPGDRPGERHPSPRAGDGVVRLDVDGWVTYASPNAISAYRRLGRLEHLIGRCLADVDPRRDELVDALRERRAVESEVEADGAVVLRRLLPLLVDGSLVGGLVLVREVTELRHQERALRRKDTTIREVHHRVKNNLQTVASLLRLQGRRLRSAEARGALAESVRRITSIAYVHETLSQETRQRVAFTEIAQRIVDMLADGLVDPDVPVVFKLEGDPGQLPAEVATPLALVLTELLQNSAEHAFDERGGTVRVLFDRGPATLRAVVSDDGVGLPGDVTLDELSGLGLQIARTLVENELGGAIRRNPGNGTELELRIPLP